MTVERSGAEGKNEGEGYSAKTGHSHDAPVTGGRRWRSVRPREQDGGKKSQGSGQYKPEVNEQKVSCCGIFSSL